MKKKRLVDDLNRIYFLIQKRNTKLNLMYELVDSHDENRLKILKKLADICDIKLTKQNKIALLTRLINLREDSLIQVLENENNKKKDIDKKLQKVYKVVSNFHIKLHSNLIKQIAKENLLNDFYQTLFKGFHEVGVVMTKWQPKWTKYIINEINPKLLKEFKTNEKVMQFLLQNNLLEKNSDGSIADRSYSVLVKHEGKYKTQAYATFFKKEVHEVIEKLQDLIDSLKNKNDDIFDAKDVYIGYFLSLINAFKEEDTNKLISRWQDVDFAWMKIQTPIQVAHPLEYYEDHFRKAVALEWDIRLSNPKNLGTKNSEQNIEKMYKKLFLQVNNELDEIYEKSLKNIHKTALFIGRPLFYYAAQFNGLFSAQVVPNDEFVSHKAGKKIFGFADNIYESIKAKPFMKISSVIFDKKFLKKERELLFQKPELWHKIYEITTIGHEFGHILWMNEDTEVKMNKSGVFKNIEEFKATSGGLMAFFENIDEEILECVINDTLKRAIGLISWMKTKEVEPYYVEALIHLNGLFESGILSFHERLEICTNKENIERLIAWYYQTYKNLAKHYLTKKDAKEFLEIFATKDDDVYLPKEKSIKRFVEYYHELYKTIGRDVDDSDKKENYI